MVGSFHPIMSDGFCAGVMTEVSNVGGLGWTQPANIMY